MPRRRRTPSYRLHKARKCGVVTIDGTDHYLGPYNSPESLEKYYRLLAEWSAAGRHTSIKYVLIALDELETAGLVIVADRREGPDGYWMKSFPVVGSRHYRFEIFRKVDRAAVTRRSVVVRLL